MQNIESLDPAHAAQVAFGKNVRDRRVNLGWTQKELAERITDGGLKMHQGTIAKIENGTRPTSVGELSVIAGAFRTSAARLVREDDWDPDGLDIYLRLEKAKSKFFRARYELRGPWRDFWEYRLELAHAVADAREYRVNGDVASLEVHSRLAHLMLSSEGLLEADVNDYLSKANSEYGVRIHHGVDQEAT